MLNWLLTSTCIGLGQYLSSIDPQERPARWHVPHIMITCRVHFFRGIEKAIGHRKHDAIEFQTMASLLNCETHADYYTTIQLLQGKWFLTGFSVVPN